MSSFQLNFLIYKSWFKLQLLTLSYIRKWELYFQLFVTNFNLKDQVDQMYAALRKLLELKQQLAKTALVKNFRPNFSQEQVESLVETLDVNIHDRMVFGVLVWFWAPKETKNSTTYLEFNEKMNKWLQNILSDIQRIYVPIKKIANEVLDSQQPMYFGSVRQFREANVKVLHQLLSVFFAINMYEVNLVSVYQSIGLWKFRRGKIPCIYD